MTRAFDPSPAIFINVAAAQSAAKSFLDADSNLQSAAIRRRVRAGATLGYTVSLHGRRGVRVLSNGEYEGMVA